MGGTTIGGRSKKSKFSEEQVLGILKEVEGGKSVAEVSRHYGITEQTFYRWRNKYGGLSVSEMKRLLTFPHS